MLALIYNRDQSYNEALAILTDLQSRYPDNRLLWLEAGATSLRAGRFEEAKRTLDDGLKKLSTAPLKAFGEDALWRYKRGTARAAIGRSADGEQDLRAAVSLEGRRWVHGRAHLELGKLALQAGNRRAANQEFRAAIALCESDNDDVWADLARRLMK